MKKVIVLGSNGQLGETIKDFANTDTNDFHFFSRNEIDITDKNSLVKAFKDSGFDYCINCAAYTNVEAAESHIEDAFLINAEGAKNIAEVCDTHKVKLIHISTDYVFSGEKSSPYTINDVAKPINQYGKSKLQGESYIKDQLKEHHIIRVSWLYSIHGKNFLKTIINKIENDAILNITTEEEGTPTSCIDLVAFLLQIINKDSLPYGIYNFSAKGSTTWFGFAKEVVENFNFEKRDNVQPIASYKTIAERPKYSVLNLQETEKLYKELNTWQKSIGVMVAAYRNRRS